MLALTAKLDKFARKCYRIMLGKCQIETHMTNTHIYRMEYPISETLHERQLQFTGHYFRKSKDEPANIYVICQDKIKWSKRRGNPSLTYLDRLSKPEHLRNS